MFFCRRPSTVPSITRTASCMKRGREEDVPDLVLTTLRHTRLRQSSKHSPFAQQAMTIMQMGITALRMSGRHYKSARRSPA
ncbi:hypothetical protein WJX73_010687 [Symbiochloris irregularis]|uniref:Uncharacterized protein n=1 Tax=Symbiochloris irregularis TaxID=706552 RepID=A0AAW1PC20_9CHLO